MVDQTLKDRVTASLLPRVQTPAQYVGGELNSARPGDCPGGGRICLAFPDTYSIGMSNYGLQVLYATMNRREDWTCERVFAPMIDMDELLRQSDMPLYSLESFTPLHLFDVLGFTLQYELCYSNVLTILDLGRIPIEARHRTIEHPLVIAGGPSANNPEPMARFIDLFVIGDGEEVLPVVCDEWLKAKASSDSREKALERLARRVEHVYVPRFYEQVHIDGKAVAPVPKFDGLPTVITPAVVKELDSEPIPTSPIVPNIECVQDRIAIEIMRGCPGRCRFCQSTTLKRPLRYRQVDTIVRAALKSYANTGYNEISLLSLSTSDYPYFEELMVRLYDTFRPLGVSISVPSLRVNEQWRTLGDLLDTSRRSGLTLAPEAARDDMRRRIGKRVRNEDLLEGCRRAFERGFRRVKLYFMCGLPGERKSDLDGIIELAETVSKIGKDVTGRFVKVVASVSNFVPKPHTPLQWHGMQSGKYFRWVREYVFDQRRLRSVSVQFHDVETSLLEGVLSRGDRRVGHGIELAWRRGARFDAWKEHFRARLWWEALEDAHADVESTLYAPYQVEAPLPWDHVAIRQGRGYLERESEKALG